MLSLDLLRGGNRSVYGELEILHLAPGGQETQLYFARGLAVYFPTPKRTRNIELKQASSQLLQTGQLLARFIESEDMHGDQSAELLIPLGGEPVQVQ